MYLRGFLSLHQQQLLENQQRRQDCRQPLLRVAMVSSLLSYLNLEYATCIIQNLLLMENCVLNSIQLTIKSSDIDSNIDVP